MEEAHPSEVSSISAVKFLPVTDKSGEWSAWCNLTNSPLPAILVPFVREFFQVSSILLSNEIVLNSLENI